MVLSDAEGVRPRLVEYDVTTAIPTVVRTVLLEGDTGDVETCAPHHSIAWTGDDVIALSCSEVADQAPTWQLATLPPTSVGGSLTGARRLSPMGRLGAGFDTFSMLTAISGGHALALAEPYCPEDDSCSPDAPAAAMVVIQLSDGEVTKLIHSAALRDRILSVTGTPGRPAVLISKQSGGSVLLYEGVNGLRAVSGLPTSMVEASVLPR
jgi:hypothetical protein